DHRVGGDDVPGLVGIEAEDGAPDEVRWALLDDADIEVAVLHRPREVAVLERSAHGGDEARGDLAAGDESLRAPADRAVERADQDLVGAGSRQLDGPDLSLPGRAEPEGLGS